MKLTEKQREFLENPFVGTITDLRPDGSPHTTVVWVDVDDGGVSFNTAYGRAKPTYIADDSRVSLTVVDPADPYRWLSVSGRRRSSTRARTTTSTAWRRSTSVPTPIPSVSLTSAA